MDGGVGQGVRLGGSDTGMPPAGFRSSVDPVDDEDSTSYEVYTNLIDDGEDENPGDRRRDPLRRT